MKKNYQTKLGNYIPKDDLKTLHSSEFLEEIKLNEVFDIALLPTHPNRIYPNAANLAFIIYKQIMGFSTYTGALRYASKQPGLYKKMGYDEKHPPNIESIKNFNHNILTKKGLNEIQAVVEQFRHNNNIFITDSFLPSQPLQSDYKPRLTSKEKRAVVKACLKYINDFAHVDLKKNCTYDNKTIFEAISYFIADASSINAFSTTYREEPTRGRKIRQKAPTGRTILNRLRKIFDNREDVEKFFDFIFKRMMKYIRQKIPEAFNRRYIDVAFDYHLVPAYDNTEKYVQKQLTPEEFKRNTYTNSIDLISDAHIKGKGTINFRKFLCASIAVNGYRFCLCYLPITMMNNNQQAVLINKMIDKIKTHINSRWIRRFYLDREFDRLNTHIILRKRGINYVMAKKRTKGELKNKIDAVKDDLDVFKYKMSKTVKLNIIVIKGKIKNKFIDPNDSGSLDGEERKKFAFCTNINITKSEAEKLIQGYRSRWSIENMFKEKNKLFGKTTSNDNIIRDFYFSYTLIIFNLWILCNLVIFYIYLKQEPSEPKIRMTTYKNYIKNTEFNPPGD